MDRPVNRVRSAAFSDALDQLGLPAQALASDIGPVTTQAWCAGRAATVRFETAATSDEEPYDEIIGFIDTLTPGTVVLIETPHDAVSAHWGELFSIAANFRGTAGVVCDGPIRDSAQIDALGFPVFARGRMPTDFAGRALVAEVGGDIVCGGAQVSPGDWVVADSDGIVVGPPSAGPALDKAAAKLELEMQIVADLRAGRSLRYVWDTYRAL